MKKIFNIMIIFLISLTITSAKAATDDEVEEALKNIFLINHPVGSIYITTNSDESTVEKMNSKYGGTWEVYGENRTIRSSTSSAGTTGGSNSNVTLTVNNIPAHTHTITPAGTVTSTFSSGVAASNGAHQHYLLNTGTLGTDSYINYTTAQNLYIAKQNNGSTVIQAYALQYSLAYTSSGANTGLSSSAGAHTHTVTGTVTSQFTGTSGTTSSVGKSSPDSFNTVDAYVTAYIYKRIS